MLNSFHSISCVVRSHHQPARQTLSRPGSVNRLCLVLCCLDWAISISEKFDQFLNLGARALLYIPSHKGSNPFFNEKLAPLTLAMQSTSLQPAALRESWQNEKTESNCNETLKYFHQLVNQDNEAWAKLVQAWHSGSARHPLINSTCVLACSCPLGNVR